MIVQLTGTLVEAFPTHAVLDVGGVGYELGISANTAASLPAVGEAGVTLYTRLIVREDAMELYGFATRQERALFDRLISISRVGPSLALSTLSTFTPQALATVVATQDVTRMTQVSGVGKMNAQRILMELQDVFAKDAELRSLVGLSTQQEIRASDLRPQTQSVVAEATEALLGMGFAPQEAELALEGLDGQADVSAAVRYALKRLG